MAEELEENDVEEILNPEENPSFRFTRTLDEDDYEIVDEEETGPTREELEAEVERQKAALLLAQAKAGGLGKEDLVEILKEVRKSSPTSNPTPPVQQKGESDEDFLKRFNENLFEGNAGELIVEAVKRFGGASVAPVLQGNFEISKELVMGNADLGPIYREYEEEVEAEINKLPMNQRLQIPHIYKRATEEVARRHWKDLRKVGVEEMVKAEVDKMREELGLKKGEKGSSSGPIYSESSINRPSPTERVAGGKKRIPKPSPMEQKYGDTKGISWPQLYESLQRNPGLKKRINEGGIPWLR